MSDCTNPLDEFMRIRGASKYDYHYHHQQQLDGATTGEAPSQNVMRKDHMTTDSIKYGM